MQRPDDGHIGLQATAYREGGVWRVRLSGPPWLLGDLARELDETGQQLDIVATVPDAGKDQMWGIQLSSIDLSVAPRRKRAKPQPKVIGSNVIHVDREAFFKP